MLEMWKTSEGTFVIILLFFLIGGQIALVPYIGAVATGHGDPCRTVGEQLSNDLIGLRTFVHLEFEDITRTLGRWFHGIFLWNTLEPYPHLLGIVIASHAAFPKIGKVGHNAIAYHPQITARTRNIDTAGGTALRQ